MQIKDAQAFVGIYRRIKTGRYDVVHTLRRRRDGKGAHLRQGGRAGGVGVLRGRNYLAVWRCGDSPCAYGGAPQAGVPAFRAREGNRPRSDGRDGLRVVRVLEAAQRSLDFLKVLHRTVEWYRQEALGRRRLLSRHSSEEGESRDTMAGRGRSPGWWAGRLAWRGRRFRTRGAVDRGLSVWACTVSAVQKSHTTGTRPSRSTLGSVRRLHVHRYTMTVREERMTGRLEATQGGILEDQQSLASRRARCEGVSTRVRLPRPRGTVPRGHYRPESAK